MPRGANSPLAFHTAFSDRAIHTGDQIQLKLYDAGQFLAAPATPQRLMKMLLAMTLNPKQQDKIVIVTSLLG